MTDAWDLLADWRATLARADALDAAAREAEHDRPFHAYQARRAADDLRQRAAVKAAALMRAGIDLDQREAA